MKKRIQLFLFISILILLISPFISAASFDFNNAQSQVKRVIDSALGILSPFFQEIIGDYSNSDFFFSKVLLFILLIVIIKNVLDRTPIGSDNKRISLLVSIIVSILSVRFINENKFFEAIFIQYGVLGIAITTILPTVIFFYFVHNTNVGTYGRKVFWTFYAITFLAIWILKSSEIPEVANWIYGLTFTAAIIFIFFDKSIHSYLGLSHLSVFMKRENKEGIWRAKERIHRLNQRRDNRIISEYEWRHGIQEEEKIIKELSKE